MGGKRRGFNVDDDDTPAQKIAKLQAELDRRIDQGRKRSQRFREKGNAAKAAAKQRQDRIAQETAMVANRANEKAVARKQRTENDQKTFTNAQPRTPGQTTITPTAAPTSNRKKYVLQKFTTSCLCLTPF